MPGLQDLSLVIILLAYQVARSQGHLPKLTFSHPSPNPFAAPYVNLSFYAPHDPFPNPLCCHHACAISCVAISLQASPRVTVWLHSPMAASASTVWRQRACCCRCAHVPHALRWWLCSPADSRHLLVGVCAICESDLPRSGCDSERLFAGCSRVCTSSGVCTPE